MSVRKRTWKTKAGETKESWIVDYKDRQKNRVMRTFSLKKEAEDFATTMKSEMRDGIHVARSKSPTVAEAGKFWIDTAETGDPPLERATIADYQRLLDMHITPFIGATKLSDLSVPMVRAFEDKLRKEGRSAAMVKRVRCALSMLLSDAVERSLVARNVVRDVKSKSSQRHERQIEVGVDIPTTDEASAIMASLTGRWRPLILVAMFCGLRSSELRGLRWQDVDLAEMKIHVRQRADRYHKIGPPKSRTGRRKVPLLPMVANALREWKLVCPKGDLDLVFPNRIGNIESHPNIVARGLCPVQVAAGVVDENGKAKYTGMHALRHFFASWCINPVEKGGRGLPAKVVQTWLGHKSITMTLDVYGHLFPDGDDPAELEAAEKNFKQHAARTRHGG
jgi:integrase